QSILINQSLFSFNAPPTTEIYTLSLHDALPILNVGSKAKEARDLAQAGAGDVAQPGQLGVAGHLARANQIVEAHGQGHETRDARSEEHTSELQSRSDLVCRLLLEKKKKKIQNQT